MTTAGATLPQVHSFPAMLKQHQAEIARALPRHLNPDRMTRIALTEFRKNPRLAECDPRSVFAAVIMASQLGLEPGLMGQCYLIPYKSECQLIPGYQGLLDLVRRSGKVKRIEAQVVYTNDRFTYKTGLFVTLEHEPLLDGDRGEPRLAYAVAEFADGGHHVEIMSRAQIEAIRDRGSNSQNAKRWGKKTPWDTDADQMWRKTVLRRLCKFLPKSVELATALSLDDAAGQGQKLNVREVIEGNWAPPPVADEEPLPPIAIIATTPEPPAEMNPETGEIPDPTQSAPEPELPPADPCADLLMLIGEAQTTADLDALSRDIGRLRNGERSRCIAAWKARKSDLSKAA
jgi:recombination protein RecT